MSLRRYGAGEVIGRGAGWLASVSALCGGTPRGLSAPRRASEVGAAMRWLVVRSAQGRWACSARWIALDGPTPTAHRCRTGVGPSGASRSRSPGPPHRVAPTQPEVGPSGVISSRSTGQRGSEAMQAAGPGRRGRPTPPRAAGSARSPRCPEPRTAAPTRRALNATDARAASHQRSAMLQDVEHLPMRIAHEEPPHAPRLVGQRVHDSWPAAPLLRTRHQHHQLRSRRPA